MLGICRLLSMHRVSTTQTYAEILLIQDSDADRNRGSNLSITLQAIVLAILGFTWGGWVTSGTAALARTWWPGPPMQESAGSGPLSLLATAMRCDLSKWPCSASCDAAAKLRKADRAYIGGLSCGDGGITRRLAAGCGFPGRPDDGKPIGHYDRA